MLGRGVGGLVIYFIFTPFHGRENLGQTKNGCLNINFNSPINGTAPCKEDDTQPQTESGIRQLQTQMRN